MQETKREKDVPSSVSYIYGVLFIVFLIGLLSASYFIEISLPTALTYEDELDYPTRFIAESAKDYLRVLTSFGPRVVGSYENEVLAVEYLTDEITKIIENKNSVQKIEYDLQLSTGSYYLAYKPYGSINAYANLQNIVVKVHSRDASQSSILVNAHYDTMTTSPGGSDDGIHCAIMLEILRKLSQLADTPLNNIIFLFNGGEESNIQASHGFITQHKWAKEAKVVINLEATGAGGKEILFQAGPEQAWLMKYYSHVPHPFAHVAGEEIFKSNIIPSDSDFRIFRDFGGLVGYDFAYIKDGYRYHTKYDGFDNIEDGRYQRTGDNILQLIKGLSEAQEVSQPYVKSDGTVFFDVFGGFMIYYGTTVELVINITVIILSVVVLIWSLFHFQIGLTSRNTMVLLLKFLEIILEWIASSIVVVLIALILGGINRTMGWYKLPYLAIGLYAFPTVICCLGVLLLMNKYLRKDSLAVQENILLHAHLTRFIWTVIVLIGTCYRIKSVYLLLIPIIFNLVAVSIIHVFKMHMSTKWWMAIYIIGSIIPTMFIYSIGYHILALFIPICGRFGTDINPEFIVGLFTMLLTILAICFYIPLILLIGRPVHVLLGLLSCFLATIIILLTPVGFPYSGESGQIAPQRFGIFHTQRIFHDASGNIMKNDSGFHFLNMDYNSPGSIRSYITELDDVVSLEEDCKTVLFCGLPVVYSRDFEELEKSVWIPTDPPIFNDTLPALILESIQMLNKTVIRYNLRVTGPDCMDIYLSPKKGINFLKTNLNDFIPDEQPLFNGRPTLYILFVYGKEPAPLQFYIDFEAPENWGDPVFDIAITGKYIHDNRNVMTKHYQHFLNQFPTFTAINLMALGYYESWEI